MMNEKMTRTVTTDQLGEVLIAIEKADFFLRDLLSDYGNEIDKDPRAYNRFLYADPECTDRDRKTASWILEHERIIGFIDTAQDYILKAKNEVEGFVEERTEEAI